MAFDPNVYDEVTVTESVTAELPDALEISVSDTVTVADSVATAGFEWNISVYDEVTVLESVSGFSMRIYTDPRPDRSPKWPTWSLEASTQMHMSLEERLAGRVIEARFGADLKSYRMPGWLFEGTIAESPLLELDTYSPSYSIAGWFGCVLEENSHLWEIDLSLVQYDILRLEETVAGWTIDAAMLVEGDLTLTANIPRWKLEGVIERSDIASLDEALPFWTVKSNVLSGTLIELDGKIPVWVPDTSVYSAGMNLDVSTPTRVMSAVGTGDDYGGGKDTGEMTDNTRFVGYILEHGE